MVLSPHQAGGRLLKREQPETDAISAENGYFSAHLKTSLDMAGVYPVNFEAKIGFDRVREMLKHHCVSPLGEEWVDRMQFTADYDFLVERLCESSEFLRILAEFPQFPVTHYYDVRRVLNHIRPEGRFMEVEELFDLKRSLEALRAVVYFFGPEKAQILPLLYRKARQIMVYPSVQERIDIILDRNGKIRDKASPELARIRQEMAALQAGISRRLQALLKQAQKEGWAEEGSSVSIRDGRAVIPVPSAHKRKIKGIVYDESATGKTAYIEPAEIVEMNNTIRELENEERREIMRILIRLCDEIRPYIDDLIASNEFLGEIDFIRSKALLARVFGAIRPDFSDMPALEWKQAVHPLLMLSLQRENRKIVPLNLSLTPENRILLISGPNAGGKSVCLKSVGLLQYMLQNGLLIPVGEGSKTGIFGQLFIDIGDEQSIENDLSTYSSHLLNMKYFLRNSDGRTLVLIDEFGTGTEPMLGGAIAEAILGQLNRQGAYGVITTHYTNLKHYAASAPGVINGAMLYDAQKMDPLFMLEIGKPGSSFAFEIARKIGLPEPLLQEAADKVGRKQIDFDKNLRSITRDKVYWENKRQKIRKVEKSVDELAGTYSRELEEIRLQRKEILRAAREEARAMVAGVNRQIENAIREIRETQAARESTRQVREEMERLRQEMASGEIHDDQIVAAGAEKVKKAEKRLRRGTPPEVEKTPQENVKPVRSAPSAGEERSWKVGDRVRIRGQELSGELVDLNEKNGVVAFGQLISTVPLRNLERADGQGEKTPTKKGRSGMSMTLDFGERRLNFKSEIDVRGERAEAALARIQVWLDEAVMFQVSRLRILHGKGEGILKEMIRSYLRAEPVVGRVADEDVRFGGAGITVVELDL